MLKIEGQITLIDGIPATVVLAALILNTLVGPWRVDPAAGCVPSTAPSAMLVRRSITKANLNLALNYGKFA